MQVTLQFQHRVVVLGSLLIYLLLRPLVQGVVTHFQQFIRFVDENRQQLVILFPGHPVAQHRQGIDEVAGWFCFVFRYFDRMFFKILRQCLETDLEIFGNIRQLPAGNQFLGHA